MIWSDIPKDLDVLLTHGPPWGILDEVLEYNKDLLGMHKENVGDKMLLSKVIQKKPKIHSFGHLHECYGVLENIKYAPNTTFINCSVVNEQYDVINEPIEIDI